MSKPQNFSRLLYGLLAVVVVVAGGAVAVTRMTFGQPGSPITVDYPVKGALFPPDFAPPTIE